jgi:hypothetical protein
MFCQLRWHLRTHKRKFLSLNYYKLTNLFENFYFLNRNSEMLRNVITHHTISGEKLVFRCQDCNRDFKNEKGLKTHRTRIH